MTATPAHVWRCGHLCLIDAPESYRALRMCPECRVRRYPLVIPQYVTARSPGRVTHKRIDRRRG